jgi:hypothetical protein
LFLGKTAKTVEENYLHLSPDYLRQAVVDSVDCRSICRSIVEIERQTVDILLILSTPVNSNETL